MQATIVIRKEVADNDEAKRVYEAVKTAIDPIIDCTLSMSVTETVGPEEI